MRLIRRVVATCLVAATGFLPVPASAGPLTEAIATAANKAAAAQARPNARGSDDDNPHEVISIVLMAAGGVVTLYGLTHVSGYEFTSDFEFKETKSKTTIFTGVGMIGLGAYLFQKGRSASPEILAGPHVVGIRQRLAW